MHTGRIHEGASLDLGYLSRRFRRMSQALRNTVAAPIFFITLHPRLWADQYFGMIGEPAAGKGRWLTARISELAEQLQAADWRALDSIADTLVHDLHGQAPEEITAAAVAVLLSEPVGMGSWPQPANDGKYIGKERLVSDFMLAAEDKPTPGWFQDALDFGCVCDCKISRFNNLPSCARDRSFCRFHDFFDGGGRARILEVKEYVKREGLMVGRLKIFVAEYLYYLAATDQISNGDERPRPSELDHFFLPLRVLGQWRASACWLASNPIAKPAQTLQPSREQAIALEDLIANSIFEMFSARIEIAAPTMSSNAPGQIWLFEPASETYYNDIMDAFAILWWADEILLLEDRQCLHRVCRNQSGDLVTAPGGVACEALLARERLLAWEMTPQGLWLQLNLLTTPDSARMGERLGISSVQYRIRLVKLPSEARDWREVWVGYERQLEEVFSRLTENQYSDLGG